jgi:Tfp pilus assembly protein PilF
MTGASGRRVGLAALVWALALALYLPSVRHGFIGYDDPLYVSENRHVLQGFTREGLRWSLTATEGGNWHPLTWWSHMLAVELFGTWAGGHHLVNALLHASSAAALFLAVTGLTGALLPSLAVALLFAVHPLHVESVAWVSERKDVLEALLWMLALMAWIAFARRRRWRSYGLALLLFVLALMAKPMAVVLPLAFLVLDFWPLDRLHRSPGRPAGRLLAEKIPFFIGAAAGAALSIAAQHDVGALWVLSEAPAAFREPLVQMRASNATLSAVTYLGKALWPAGLAVFYPYPAHGMPAANVALAALVLSGFTATAVFLRRRAPWCTAGWAWYLLVVAPVIGLVQVGSQGRADRYAYLPLIGIWLAAAWSVRELLLGRPRLRPAVLLLTAVAIALFAFIAARQISFWRSTTRLFEHALEVTDGNYQAYRLLGEEARRLGHRAEAVNRFRQGVLAAPRSSGAHNRLGMALFEEGKLDEAASAYREAIRINPENAEAHNNLGVALTALGELPEAEGQLRQALLLSPAVAEIWANLGDNLVRQGRLDEGADGYRRALELNPSLAQVRSRLERLPANGDRGR